MTATTRLGGVKLNVKSGAYKLALNNNRIFAANISAALKATPKYVLGALAAEALVGAIESTIQDSSRAAANWDLAFSGKGSRSDLMPKNYNEAGPSWGSIGTRGDAGVNASSIMASKKMFYGIGSVGGPWNQALPGGTLHDAIGIGKPGTAPRVELFNPIMGEAKKRRAGSAAIPAATYAYYAFGGASPGSWLKGLEHSKEVVGSGFVPWMLIKLNIEVQRATAAGQIIKL